MAQAVDVFEIEEELEERIKVLRRYRRMLELQRDRLQGFLQLIDTREAAVNKGDFDGLEEYTLQEQQAIKGIMAVQRCIEPLADMYRKVAPEGSPDIDELQDRLEKLRVKVLDRNEQNRSILRQHMDLLREEVKSLQVPRNRNSVYARTPEPQLLNISG